MCKDVRFSTGVDGTGYKRAASLQLWLQMDLIRIELVEVFIL